MIPVSRPPEGRERSCTAAACLRLHDIHGFKKIAKGRAMNQSLLFVVIGALAVVAVGASYLYYQERQGGVAIEINGHGVSIDGN